MVNLPDYHEENDDEIILPADTLAILNEFWHEQAVLESNEIISNGGERTFGENWQLSQFWYDEATKQTLAKICLKLILSRRHKIPTDDIKIGLLSCPSLYKSIRSIHPNGIVRLFEYDQRFNVYATDYVHYDYKTAITDSQYLNEYANYFDIIIADPPFLSEECIQAVSVLVNRMRKCDSSIILCSGDVIANWAHTYMGLQQCNYRPQHERNLANEFRSYANFKLDEMM